jgi:uncharacterized protein YaaN involved in tellurite resistance
MTTVTLPAKIVTDEMLSNIGKDTGNALSTITNHMLELQKATDTGALGDKINELLNASREMSAENFKKGPLQQAISKVLRIKDNALARFQTAQDKVNQLVRKYDVARQEEVKNIAQIGELSKANYELCKRLISNLEQYEEAIVTIEAEIAAYGTDTTNLTFEESKSLADARSRLDKATMNRNQTQSLKVLSMQADPSIEGMKATSSFVIQQLDNITQNIIPTYTIFFIKYLQAKQTEGKLNLIKKSKEITNQAVIAAGELSAQNAINAAKMSQDEFIDIETVRKDHETMINSIAEVKRIQEEGRQRRQAAFGELKALEQKTIEAFSKN